MEAHQPARPPRSSGMVERGRDRLARCLNFVRGCEATTLTTLGHGMGDHALGDGSCPEHLGLEGMYVVRFSASGLTGGGGGGAPIRIDRELA